MPRPASLPLTAGAQMMLGGVVRLALSLATGELHSMPHVSLRAGLALLYLIVGGCRGGHEGRGRRQAGTSALLNAPLTAGALASPQ